MPIITTTERVAKAINKLRDELQLEYGENHTYSITVNNGMVIAQHGIYGVEQPAPLVTGTGVCLVNQLSRKV